MWRFLYRAATSSVFPPDNPNPCAINSEKKQHALATSHSGQSTVRHVVPQIVRRHGPIVVVPTFSPAKRNRWCKQATKQPAVAANIRPRQRAQKSGEGNPLRCYISAESIRVKHYQTETAKAPRHCRDQKWPLRRRAARAMVPRSAPAFRSSPAGTRHTD